MISPLHTSGLECLKAASLLAILKKNISQRGIFTSSDDGMGVT